MVMDCQNENTCSSTDSGSSSTATATLSVRYDEAGLSSKDSADFKMEGDEGRSRESRRGVVERSRSSGSGSRSVMVSGRAGGSVTGLDGGSEKSSKKQKSTSVFHCEVCQAAFNQKIHLTKHSAKHTGIKPFKCSECNYSTVERSHLKVHVRVHTGEKPFKCTFCEYATAQSSTLKVATHFR